MFAEPAAEHEVGGPPPRGARSASTAGHAPTRQRLGAPNLPSKVLEAKQMAGIPNATVSHPILYFFLWPFFFTNDLNEVWAAAQGGGVQQLPPGY